MGDAEGQKLLKKGRNNQQKEEEPEEPAIPMLSDEDMQFLEDKRKFHYDWIVDMKPRIYSWCDEIVSLEPLFNYDMEFVPSHKLEDKDYVDDWMEEQTTADGINCASTVRDITKNAEILLALPA